METIMLANVLPNLLAADDPLDHVLPHHLIHLGDFVITNQMIMAVIAALLMLAIFPILFNRAYVGAPSGARNFFESILEFLRVEDRKSTRLNSSHLVISYD